MATLKVDTITSDTLPTVSLTDGLVVSGVTTMSNTVNVTSGRLLHGTTASRSIADGTPNVQVEGTAGTASLGLVRNQNNSGGSNISFAKSRGTSVGSATIVQDDDTLGNINFAAADGTDINTIAASIVAQVDGTPGANDMPGRLIFKTTADGANSATERLRITSAGYVGVGEASPATILHVKANVGDMLRLDRNNTGAVGNQIAFRHSASGTLTETGSINCVSAADAASGDLRFYTKASGASNAEKLRISSSGQLSTGAESAPDVSAGGLCLNQGAADTNIFSLKSSDIAHGVTTYDETDTYFSIRKSSGDKGGARIHGFTDTAGGDAALEFQGIINSDADQGYCPIEFRGSEANGTGVQNIAADRRIVNIKNSDGTRIASFTGTGLTFGNDSATANALDDYEEGQWTVQLTGAGSGTSNDGDSGTGFDTASGVYTKVGNTCYFTMHLANVHDGDCTGDLRFSLPFTAGNGQSSTSSLRTVGACVFSGVNYTASGQANVYIESGNAFAIIAETIDNTSLDFINVGNVDSDANDIYLSGFFFV